MSQGIQNYRIDATPIAILDFETTGLVPGFDRIIEVGVVRRDPGKGPRVVLDTLVNPLRPVARTRIHGIRDAYVAHAPTFPQIAGNLLDAVSGCVVSAYNADFDVQFLTTELRAVGVRRNVPYVCLMYMRPMLNLGRACKLEHACQAHGIAYDTPHVAVNDVQVSAQLLEVYLPVLQERGICTYSDLTHLGDYRFTRSFANVPLPGPAAYGLSPHGEMLSRAT